VRSTRGCVYFHGSRSALSVSPSSSALALIEAAGVDALG
jgi:hypothetical protein